MNPLTSYLGIPWVQNGRSPDGFDCYGLVWWFYHKHLGIDLSDHVMDDATELLDHAIKGCKEEAPKWVELQKPVDGCAVMMSRNKVFHHVGVYYAGKVYHVEKKNPVSAIPINRLKQQFSNFKFYQYADDN